MGLRIAEPTPLRTVGFGATVAGTLVTVVAGFQGPAALVGVAILSVGVALLDAVDVGRVGWRQLGVFLVALGSVLAAWGLAVTVLLAMLGLPLDRIPLLLVVCGGLGAVVGLFLMRFWPRPMPAIVADRSAIGDGRRRPEAPESEPLDRLAG